MVWSKELAKAEANEAPKVRFDIIRYTVGKGLDIGCGMEKVFPHAIGVDSNIDERLFNKRAVGADVVIEDAVNMPIFGSAFFDWVFSSHLLEHIEDHKKALKEWWRLVKPGGYLILYLPHKDLYPNIGDPWGNPDHKHDFVNDDIIEAMKEVALGWDLRHNEVRNDHEEYSFLQVYQKLGKKTHEFSCDKPRPEKKAAIIRYGAYGDNMQSSAIAAELKKQGYHITWYCQERGYDVLREDPHIDDFIVCRQNHIPNHLLAYYWVWEERKYDKFVNLTQSVEGSMLVEDHMPQSRWPKNLRHSLCNRNYVELAYEIAGIRYNGDPQIHFYETLEERMWADKKVRGWGGSPTIMMALSGSGVHKVWPHMDSFIARVLLHYARAKIIFVGGEGDEILEDPWRKEPRVICLAGAISIRESLALAKRCDVVIGPETGVLNAVAMEPMAKICILSHSSHENLTRDWRNTYSVFSNSTPCYPCHILHRGFDLCPRDVELGTAQCQADIPADAVWASFVESQKEAA